MPVSIIVGGQYGGEGKGKVSSFFAQQQNASIVVKVGGSNSGHTVYDSKGQKFIFRQLPTAALLPGVNCVISAGTYIDFLTLFSEIELTKISSNRLWIDPNAVLITHDDIHNESQDLLKFKIGSTLSGTGAAIIRRVSRISNIKFAKDIEQLKPYIKPVKSLMRQALKNNERIIIEGTQGFGLSVLHASDYPYVTSRDTTAAAFLSETGLSPVDVDDIILVLRTFPIRVAGNSGSLPQEIEWGMLTTEKESSELIVEYSSVTQRVRRVARFDSRIVLEAIEVNNPTKIVLNHLDYCLTNRELLNYKKEFPFKATEIVNKINCLIQNKINYVGFDPFTLYKICQ